MRAVRWVRRCMLARCHPSCASCTVSLPQGAGDDEESWSGGLSAAQFWRHSEVLIAAARESEQACDHRVEQLIAQVPSCDARSPGHARTYAQLRTRSQASHAKARACTALHCTALHCGRWAHSVAGQCRTAHVSALTESLAQIGRFGPHSRRCACSTPATARHVRIRIRTPPQCSASRAVLRLCQTDLRISLRRSLLRCAVLSSTQWRCRRHVRVARDYRPLRAPLS
jgi:hypothetical protein